MPGERRGALLGFDRALGAIEGMTRIGEALAPDEETASAYRDVSSMARDARAPGALEGAAVEVSKRAGQKVQSALLRTLFGEE